METKTKNVLVTISNTINQKKNINKNKIRTIIDLGECENKLKQHYNISYKESLYILKMDIQEEEMKIPKIEYEVYYPLNNNKDLIMLDLSICKNLRIDILILSI